MKKIVISLFALGLCVMMPASSLASSKVPTTSRSSSKTTQTSNVETLSSSALKTTKPKSGVAYWNCTPKQFIDALNSALVAGGGKSIDISKAQKLENKNAFQIKSNMATFTFYSTAATIDKGNLTRIVYQIDYTTKTKQADADLFAMASAFTAVIFSEYDTAKAEDIFAKVFPTSGKTNTANYKTAAYKTNLEEKRTVLTVTPN